MGKYALTLAALFAGLFLSPWAAADTLHPEWRALLASPGFEGQPVKGVYFFPGDSAGNTDYYTIHPILPEDQNWNGECFSAEVACSRKRSVCCNRERVLNCIAATGANTIVMSYWSNMPQWSPMRLDNNSVSGLLDAVDAKDRHLVIWPVIEGGFDPDQPDTPHWQFAKDFPAPFEGLFYLAPGLLTRIDEVVNILLKHQKLWAQLYDREGRPRYVIQVLHACSFLSIDDRQFADAFDRVADHVLGTHKLHIGFVLDLIGNNRDECTYVAAPATAGPILASKSSVLAVNGFASEVYSGKLKPKDQCPDPGKLARLSNWYFCNPHDNNKDNLESLADWKGEAVKAWHDNNLPLILDVSTGMDRRIMSAYDPGGIAFWGDNMDYIDDRWRNWLSELKSSKIKGIVFDTWNGYTEGYAATPTHEYGETVYRWLTDLFQPDPRDCSHMHYVNGAPTWRVYGAICEKWI